MATRNGRACRSPKAKPISGTLTPRTSNARRILTTCRRGLAPVKEIKGARVLAKLGHSVTTDHISPAGSIKTNSPAGKYLQEHGVQPSDFNSYGSRRGNHEVMVRGTFANVRLRNQLAPGSEGGITKHFPSGEIMSIFDASVKYIAAWRAADCAGRQGVWVGLVT